ncbi:MAG TPA: elongation factor P [Bdellovibrionota bacterium]|jgi:elongation factor P|nr:elongation factor P [Bdellovibrionota bacterium]
MYETRQFRKGLKLEIDGVPFAIVDFQHISPGKGSAFTRTKLRNLLNGNQTEKTFKSGEKVAQADVTTREMQFLYKDAAGYNFMDLTSYEQIILDEETLGEDVKFMKEQIVVQIMLYGEKPIGVELPTFIEALVVKTDPAFKGDTVGGSKPATIEPGAVVQVPFHIKEGDKIRVDTRECIYLEKVK